MNVEVKKHTLPKILQEHKDGFYNGYRIIELNGLFYPQEKFLWFWCSVCFSGGSDIFPKELRTGNTYVYLFRQNSFTTFEQAKYVIYLRIKPIEKSIKKIHNL